ncbi:hypothetical protein N657DRAFT_651655 [Parathielavia appendiculata]|uniref:2EXR domain-containing protein n=1 Tax=Parathielavia appendiculata TaxID=2587402 RepID=A0AAN6TP85_9PEZI|nr:hypothetical protein N657DRAFT_651655 [Parathielavia appendiculata]
MTSFPLFCNFPVELQLAIWALALPDPEPEVCIAWPLQIMEFPIAEEEPALPFVVDTAWPAIAHVCRTARQAALTSGGLRLRYSPNAGFAVPYRHFIPAIDTLYWGRDQAGAMYRFLFKPEVASFARDLRHIAVEVTGTYPHDQLADIMRLRAVFLRTLSFVLPNTLGNHSTTAAFLPPARRCKLRDISSSSWDKIKFAKVTFLRPHERVPMPLREYLAKRRRDMEESVHNLAVVGAEGTAWSTRDGSFSGVEIKAQTFVEYKTTGFENNRQEQWVEVCQDRLLGGFELQDAAAPHPRRIPVAKRKNPEEYRVLDDDSAWWSAEEFKLWLQQTNFSFDQEWYRTN